MPSIKSILLWTSFNMGCYCKTCCFRAARIAIFTAPFAGVQTKTILERLPHRNPAPDSTRGYTITVSWRLSVARLLPVSAQPYCHAWNHSEKWAGASSMHGCRHLRELQTGNAGKSPCHVKENPLRCRLPSDSAIWRWSSSSPTS